MGHVNPELLDEFLQSIDYPLFCYDRKAEDIIFDYDKKEQKVGLYIDGILCNGYPMKFGRSFLSKPNDLCVHRSFF